MTFSRCRALVSSWRMASLDRQRMPIFRQFRLYLSTPLARRPADAELIRLLPFTNPPRQWHHARNAWESSGILAFIDTRYKDLIVECSVTPGFTGDGPQSELAQV